MSGLALHTAQDELRKLGAIGLVVGWSNGYHRFYRANRDHPLYPQLLGIVQLSESLPRANHSNLRRRRRCLQEGKANGKHGRSGHELASVLSRNQNSTALSRRVCSATVVANISVSSGSR